MPRHSEGLKLERRDSGLYYAASPTEASGTMSRPASVIWAQLRAPRRASTRRWSRGALGARAAPGSARGQHAVRRGRGALAGAHQAIDRSQNFPTLSRHLRRLALRLVLQDHDQLTTVGAQDYSAARLRKVTRQTLSTSCRRCAGWPSGRTRAATCRRCPRSRRRDGACWGHRWSTRARRSPSSSRPTRSPPPSGACPHTGARRGPRSPTRSAPASSWPGRRRFARARWPSWKCPPTTAGERTPCTSAMRSTRTASGATCRSAPPRGRRSTASARTRASSSETTTDHAAPPRRQGRRHRRLSRRAHLRLRLPPLGGDPPRALQQQPAGRDVPARAQNSRPPPPATCAHSETPRSSPIPPDEILNDYFFVRGGGLEPPWLLTASTSS
jgi:hypothetical protein